MEMMFELAVNAQSENVRLTAIKNMLDRSGYKASDNVEKKN